MPIGEDRLHGVGPYRLERANRDLTLAGLEHSWPGPCPGTSADGEYTLRYSYGRRNCLPSANEISMIRLFWCSLISVGTRSGMRNIIRPGLETNRSYRIHTIGSPSWPQTSSWSKTNRRSRS